jgi:hypothetical protein
MLKRLDSDPLADYDNQLEGDMTNFGGEELGGGGERTSLAMGLQTIPVPLHLEGYEIKRGGPGT